MNRFRNLYEDEEQMIVDNYRPTQDLNERTVTKNK